MGIDATVTSSQIVAAVTEGGVSVDVAGGTVAVDVSGGVGPTGPQGPSGASALPAGTEGYVLTYVSGLWVAAAPSGAVLSVAGKTGTVTLATADITGLDTALSAKAPLASPTFTGTVSGITASMVGLGNVPNVDARARSSHTGTQLAATISDFASAVAAASPEEVIEATTVAGFPATGDTSALYVATDTSRFYRWTGSVYVEVGPVATYPATHTHAASDIASGYVATARLGSGSASSATFLRGDQAWADPIAYATTAQSQSQTSTTTVLNPARARDAILSWWSVLPNVFYSTNSGSGTAHDNIIFLDSTATASGTVLATLGSAGMAGQIFGQTSQAMDFSKQRAFRFRLNRDQGGAANGIFRALLGAQVTSAASNGTALNGRGFGIECRGTGSRFWIVAHNGTSLTEYDTGTDYANPCEIIVESDGSGTVTAYRNGTSLGSTTGGPTTASGITNLRYEVTNGGSAARYAFFVTRTHVLIA